MNFYRPIWRNEWDSLPLFVQTFPMSGTLAFRTGFETVRLGGLSVARLDRKQTANLLLDMVLRFPRNDRPWIATSANGQVLADTARDAALKAAFEMADIISCDGQPLVMSSRWVTGTALPERVATTDLFHDVAKAAARRPITMYFLGSTEEENALAVETVRRLYPHLHIVGRMHGYHSESEWPDRVAEINALRPDILWVAMGLPREQQFFARHATALNNVGLIKTCGGLFNFLSGSVPRAPRWMQKAGLEWAFRAAQEPGRLTVRYLTTNPHALFLLLTRSRRGLTSVGIEP